jgi:hypothetical protein
MYVGKVRERIMQNFADLTTRRREDPSPTPGNYPHSKQT